MSEASTDDRKRKLQALRAKASRGASTGSFKEQPESIGGVDAIAEMGEDEEQIIKKKKLVFRNYQPFDPKLKKLTAREQELRAQKLQEEQLKQNEESGPLIPVAQPISIQQQQQQAVDAIQQELDYFAKKKLESGEEELNVVPKKPNWDLKSQVADKLEKLQKRTQRAIVEILREKLAAEEMEEGLEEGEDGGSDID